MLILIFIFLLTSAIYFSSQKLLHKFFPKIFYYIPYSILFGGILLGSLFWKEATFHYNELTNYMLAIIFALVPLSMQNLKERNLGPIKKLWLYTVLQHMTQWGLIGLIALFIIKPIFLTSDNFASLIPGGFAGGHGSAAIMGEIFEKFGFADMRSLLMATATVGMGLSIIGGVFWLGRFKGEGLSLDLDDGGIALPLKNYLRPLLYLISMLFIGYYVSHLISLLFKLKIPVFAGAFIASFLASRFKFFLPSHTESAFFSDKATDLLVVFGIASIQIQVLKGSLGSISTLWIIGLLNAIFMLKFLAPRVFKKRWQESGLFVWGWSLGGLMMGFALLKGSNPRDYAKNLQEYSLAYMLISPIEISLYMVMPWLLTQNYGLVACGGITCIMGIILFQLLKKTD